MDTKVRSNKEDTNEKCKAMADTEMNLYGKISKSFYHILLHHNDTQRAGIIINKFCYRLLQSSLDLWKQRNQIKHGSKQTSLKQLQQKAETLLK